MEGDQGPRSSPAPACLTDGELQLLRLLAADLSRPAIARALAISERTLQRRTRELCARLGVATPLQAIVWAARRDLI